MVPGMRFRNAPLAANEYAPNCLNPRLTERTRPPEELATARGAEDNFPAEHRIVGEDFCKAIAKAYARRAA